MSKRVLICMLRDDISNLFLLYRKLVSTSYDVIGVYACHSSKGKIGVISQDITKLLPRVAFLGPSLIYETYISMANFPPSIDLERYNMNMVNIDIMDHLKTIHLKDIFPAQRLESQHPLHIVEEAFKVGAESVVKENFNIGVNFMDEVFDREMLLVPELPIILDKLTKYTDRKPVLHLFGFGDIGYKHRYAIVASEFASGCEVVDCTDMEYSEQLGRICSLDLLLSGPYTWGYLTYITKTPTLLIYPFYLTDYIGKTVDGNGNQRYAEIEDDNLPYELDDALQRLLVA